MRLLRALLKWQTTFRFPSGTPRLSRVEKHEAERMRHRIDAALAHMGEYLFRETQGRLSPDLRVVINKDGSVDGELRVSHLPRNFTVRKLMLILDEGYWKVPGTWISVGLRYRPREGEPHYTRFLGMSQAGTYFVRANRGAEAFLTGRKVDENMRGKKRRKAEQVYVRVHWNPWDDKPKGR